MFTTTALISLQICLVKRKPVIIALAFFVFFGFVDGLFWGASLKKVPNGAWVPLMIGLVLVILMTFWTWAKGLEDEFDGANRRNLRHFIMEDNDDSVHLALQSTAAEVLSETDDVNDDFGQYGQSQPGALYYMARTTSHGTPDEKGSREGTIVEEKRTLARIATCAVFHKLSLGAGVPHSFIGFVRQWPALPRVVIFLSVRTLPIARVAQEDRYQVTKVRSLQGFYGVTYCLGFRDDFEVKANEVIHHICALETQLNPEGHNNMVKEIKEAARTCTHIVPHYHVVSKPVSAGRLSKMLTWVRMLLIEDTYRPISTMFPETANWLGSADEIIRVGINAEI
ncbi:hypothetical protein M0805_000394 [Coniferiporia weirii]|nr:hypothetical protein M0805_000394 [Coniferiporia weirii]